MWVCVCVRVVCVCVCAFRQTTGGLTVVSMTSIKRERNRDSSKLPVGHHESAQTGVCTRDREKRLRERERDDATYRPIVSSMAQLACRETACVCKLPGGREYK